MVRWGEEEAYGVGLAEGGGREVLGWGEAGPACADYENFGLEVEDDGEGCLVCEVEVESGRSEVEVGMRGGTRFGFGLWVPLYDFAKGKSRDR
jgi:hypothetical protein